MTDRDESREKNLHAQIPFDRPRSVIDNRRLQVLTDLRLSLEIGGRKFSDLKSEQATTFLADGAPLTECWSQGRAKLRAFPRHLAQETRN